MNVVDAQQLQLELAFQEMLLLANAMPYMVQGIALDLVRKSCSKGDQIKWKSADQISGANDLIFLS